MVQAQMLAGKFLEVVPPLIHRIRREIIKSAKGNLTLAQFRVLRAIRRGIVHVGEIADLHGVSQPAMSKTVDGLVKRKLVKRVSNARDRRQMRLSLTSKGVRVCDKVRTTARVQLGASFESLSKNQISRLNNAFIEIESLLLRGER